MGNFYTVHLDPLGQTHSGTDRCSEMYTPLFDQVDAMRDLRDAFLLRLAESPPRFEHHYHEHLLPPVTLRWEALGGHAARTTVHYQNDMLASMLLLPGGREKEEEQAIAAFESHLRLHLGDEQARPVYNLARFTLRPLAIKIIWQMPEPGDMPLDLPEWCLAAAFFKSRGVI
jgi:hypothetical protein